MAGHVTLLGDSIFDNGVYVPNGPSVLDHVRRLLPPGWTATLLAVDGAKVIDVYQQLQHISKEASHVVLSIGGNDALSTAADLYDKRVQDVRAGLAAFNDIISRTGIENATALIDLRVVCREPSDYSGLSPIEPSAAYLGRLSDRE